MLNWLRTTLRAWLGIDNCLTVSQYAENVDDNLNQMNSALAALNTALVDQGKSFEKQLSAPIIGAVLRSENRNQSEIREFSSWADIINSDMALAKRMLGLLPDPELSGTRTIPMEFEHLRNRMKALESSYTAARAEVHGPCAPKKKPRTKAKKGR